MSINVTSLAEQAATAVHKLAHLTRPAITTLDVTDLRATTGALTELAAALPQILNQLSTYLQEPGDGNTITVGAQGAEPARTSLRHAAVAAAHLAAALDGAHQTLGDLAETTQIKAGGSIFNRR
ncbi:MAG TPA: hypothetical protein VFV76_04330 [Actinomycetes bacterium]|nr:hypothetical protein [Actinomycetes bacterium]